MLSSCGVAIAQLPSSGVRNREEALELSIHTKHLVWYAVLYSQGHLFVNTYMFVLNILLWYISDLKCAEARDKHDPHLFVNT